MPEEYTAEEIWAKIKSAADGRLKKQTISTWLSPSRAVSVNEHGITVELKNKFTVFYVEQNYQETLDEVAAGVLERPCHVEFVFGEEEEEDREQIDLWQHAVRQEQPGGDTDEDSSGHGQLL